MIVRAPSTGKLHRFSVISGRTRCGVEVEPRRGWVAIYTPGTKATCRHCLYPTKAVLEAART